MLVFLTMIVSTTARANVPIMTRGAWFDMKNAGVGRDYAMNKWKRWARLINRDAHAMYFAARDPRVPWYAKIIAIAVAAYALSPIDLIPDFVPVLGYLDDLVIVPLGIALVVWMIPRPILAEHRALADTALERPVSRVAAVIIVAVWITSVFIVGWIGYRHFALA